MKRLAAALGILGAAACTGLLVDKGNDFPCDFRAPEGQRDKVCAPGEVCGVDNLCRPFHYEGPQFEGKPGLPRFDAGARLHPGQLDSDVKAVVLNGSFFERPRDHTAVVVTDDGAGPKMFYVDRSRFPAVVTDVTAQVLANRPLLVGAQPDRDTVAAIFSLGNGAVASTDGGVRPIHDVLPLSDLVDLRSQSGRLAALRTGSGPLAGYLAGDVNPATGLFNPAPDNVLLDDGGTRTGGVRPFDVALVKAAAFAPLGLSLLAPSSPVAVVLTDEGFAWLDDSIAGAPLWKPLQTAAEASEVTALGGRVCRLKADFSGRLLSFINGVGDLSTLPHRVLSTWSVLRDGPTAFTVARPWSDCSPCQGGFVAGFAPGGAGQTMVEVLCASGKGNITPVRVVGSSASSPLQACDTEALATAFEPSKLRITAPRLNFNFGATDSGISFDVVQDQTVSSGIALGGPAGRVYVGPNYSSALPLFLDRLPVTTGLFPTPDGGSALAALTDRYAAVRLGDEGFEVIDPVAAAKGALQGVVVSAFVGEAPGWLVLSSGDVMRSQFGAGDIDVSFGPRLVNASDLPVPGPFIAEAVTETDGGVRSLVMTAFDSVYFARDVSALELSEGPNTLPPLRPDLTPEPNSPIRSFALERSVLGTDGINRVRGYVATARNLYLVVYGGTPARWAATPLVLTGESPVEVWMDHPRGGLGRVGYPSGEVYTLPGAFLLARSLTASGVLEGVDAGAQVAVEDYENLAGWPVAYSRSGVFVASYDPLPDGGLDNKLPDGRLGKPMTWKRVTLSNGSQPWLGKPGRLQVLTAARQGGATYTEEWTLVVFTGDEAYEAAFATRGNAQ